MKQIKSYVIYSKSSSYCQTTMEFPKFDIADIEFLISVAPQNDVFSRDKTT